MDRNPANNSQSLITRVSAQADLGIVKTASPDTALQGEEITYTLSISSTGPSLARNVQVTDTLPPGLAFVSSPSCVASSGQALCALGNLLPGDHLTVTIRTRVATFQELDIVNQAKIGSETTDDPAPLNNRTAITNSVNTKFDLAVVGAVAPVPLVAGAPITYSYAVTNFGPSVADNVELSVTLPAELYAIGQPQVLGAGSCITGTVFICDLGSLPRTQAVTVIVTGRISSTLSGPILSLAAVRSTTEANADRNPANDQTGVTSDVVQQADLRVVKSISAASVVAGNMLTYTLGVVNLGPSTAPAVTVTDTLPNEVAITGLATSLGACAGSTLVICTLSSLPPGEQATVTVTVRVNISALGVITNTADGSSTIFDPNPFNNVASISTAVTGVADLTLVKSASVSFAIAGQDSYYYDLAVGNLGPSLARNVFLTDTLPAGLSYTGFSGPAGVVCADQGGEVIGCSLNDAIPGITQTVRIDVATTSGAPGSLVNNALVTSFTPDPTPANSASATVTASQLSDLQVTKQATINNLNVGGTVTYTVNVDNFGPSNATGVVIHDLLPGALTAPSVSVVQGSYSLTSGLWTVGNVAAGQKLTMTVAGSIGSAASGQVVTNAALLYALDQTDPQLFNNGQVVTFTVPLNADLSLAQSLSSLSPPVQSTLSLVLTATNHGPETATNVQVRDLLPASLAFVSQLADSGTYSPTTGLWILPSLGSGVSQALTITAQVIGSGSFTNIASIGAAQYDHNLANNSAAAAFTAAPAADLALTQTVEPSTPNVGDTPVFTVTITNDGPDTASNVQVWDAPGSGSTVTPSAGSSYSATTNLWTIPVLAAGDFATLVISRSLALSGPISNTAEIVASSLFDPDSTPGNGLGNGEDDQVSVTLIVPPAADLGLHMSASGGQLVGQDVLLQIQMTNYGPDVATNIVLTETLPTDLTFSTHLVVGTGSFVPATGRWTIPALGVGDFTILNITARVDNGAAGQLVTDQVEGVSLDQYDPAVFPNDASVSFQVGGADLSITKSVDRAIANVGDPVVYTITVFNDGPSATSNVRITDSLPISLTAIISSTSAGDFGPNTPGGAGVWRIPTLDVGAGETLILTGTVIPGTANRIITNTISAASSSVADANTANHTPAVGFRVTAADLMLQKSATITQPQEGQSFFYILNVTNLGPDPATNVVVTDTMSTGMTTTVAGAGYDLASGRWDVGDINPGQSRSLLLTVNPIPGVGGGLVIVDPIDAKSAAQEDPTPAINAGARVTITVVGADLRLTQSVSKGAPDVGETVSFTVTLTNPGPYATGALVVTDTLPAGLTLSGTPTVTVGSLAVDATNRIFTWTHTSAAIGLSARLRLTATVDSGTGGQSLVNRAAIVSAKQTSGSAMPDPNRADNTATATVTPQAADLSIALDDSPDPVAAGATLLYTVYITNSGPTAGVSPVVTLTLPSGVTLGSISPLCESSGFPTVVCTSTSSLGVNASRSFTATVVQTSVTTLSASATTGTSTPETDTGNNSASASTTVIAAAASKLVITGSSSQTAGNSQSLTITAYDSLGNVAAAYTGDKSLTFSGASAAPDGTQPTVEDKDGGAIGFGTATTITFASGVATVVGGDNGVLALYAAETATIAATDGSISAAGSDHLTVTVSPASGAKLVIVGSSTQTAGVSQDLTITAQDSFSNTATSYSGDKSLIFSGAADATDGTDPTVTSRSGTATAFGSSTTISFTSGIATVSSGHNGAMVLVKAESVTVNASDGSINSTGGGGLAVTVSAASPAKLVISGASSQTAGASQELTITAQDAFSNTATSYSGSKTLTFSGASAAPDGTDPAVVNSSGVAVTFGSDTVITFSSGVATVSSSSNGVLALYAAETATVSASDGSIDSTGGGDLSVTVAPAAASRLVYTTQPSATASAGGTFSQQPVVEVRDAFENVATVSDDISLAAFTDSSCAIAAPGTLSGGGPVAASSGVASFSTVSYDLTGSIRLKATDDTDSGVTTACSDAISVSPGAAGSLTVETQPGGATAGGVFVTQPVIALRDSLGNIVTTDSTSTATASVQSGPGGFTSSTTTIAFASGVATFTNLRLDSAGSYTLTFSTSVGVFTVNSASFSVNPGSAAKLLISGSSSQTAGAAQNLTITALDSVGNTVTGYTGDRTLLFGGASPAPAGAPPTVTDKDGAAIAFSLPTTLTFASGVASASGGSNSLTLVKAITTTVIVTDTGTGISSAPSGNLTVTVSAGSAARLVVGGSPAQTAGITQSLTITGLDSLGNTATSYTGSKSLAFGGASAAPNGSQPSVRNSSGTTVTFGSATSISFASGVATASGGNNGVLRLVKAESATVVVTDTGGGISSAPSGNLTVTVTAAGAAKLVISGVSVQSAGATQNLTITAQDSFSNTATSYTGSKTLTFSGANAAPNGTDPSVKSSGGATVAFGGNTAINFASGVATVSGGNNGVLRLVKAESALVSASDGSIDSTGGGDLPVTVSPAAASTLRFATQPGSSATAGINFAPQPVVEVLDALQNVAGVADDISLSAFTNSTCTTAAAGALGGAGPLAAINGVATFSGVNYNQAGTIRLKATDASDGSVIAACSSAVTVAPGSAGSLTVETQPSGATAGAILSGHAVIALRDNLNNIVTTDSASTVTVTVQSGPGGFTASTTSGVLSSGLITFTNLRLDSAGSYTLRFATSAGVFTVDSASFTVASGGAAKLIISGSASQTAGATQPITITARDSFNNTATGYTGAKTLVFGGPGSAPDASQPSVTNSSGTPINFGSNTTLSFASGVAVGAGANGLLRLVKVETATVAVTDTTATSINSNSGGNLTVTVTPGSASKLVIGGSASQTAGVTQSLTITALDSVGNIDTAYTGSKSLTFSGASPAPDGTPPTVKNSSGTAVNFGSPTAINFAGGVATVSGSNNGVMALVAAESATIAVTYGTISATGADRLSVAVTPAAAEHLAFSTQPGSSATAGSNFSPQPAVQVQDQFDNVVSVSHVISLTAFTDAGCSSTATGTLGGSTSLAASSGTVTYSGVKYSKAETIRLKATNVTSGTITAACSNEVTVSHGAASRLFISVEPGGSSVGSALSPAPQVRLLDSHGNTVTSDSSSQINAEIITGTGSFISSTDQVQLSSGLAIFTNLRLSAADTYNLRFTINTASFTADSAAFVVPGGAPAKFRITGSSSQVAGATQNLTITALDSANNVASGYSGEKSLTFSFDSGVGTGLDGTPPTITDEAGSPQQIGTSTTISFTDGVAVVSGAANGALRLVRTETVIINVSDGPLSASGSDRLNVTVSPGAANNLAFSQPLSGTATAGVALTPLPVVAIRDQFFNQTTAINAVALTPFTNTGCSSTGGGTLSGGDSTSAVSGTVTFTVSYSKAETIYLKASSSGLAEACSNAVVVSPAGAAALNVVTQPAGATSGGAFTTQPTVEIRDSFGNRITSDSTSTVSASIQSGPGSFHASSTLTETVASGLATFTNLHLDIAGSYVLRFITSAGVFTTTSSSFAVGSGAATQLAITTQPDSAIAGENFGIQPVVQLRDVSNNVVSSDNSSTVTAAIQSGSGTFFVTSTLTVTVANGVATFTNLRIDKKDPYVLRFSTSAGAFIADSTSFNVSAGTATTLAFSTQPGNATAGSSFVPQPIVETRDSSGNFSTIGLPGSVTISVTLSAGSGLLQGTTSLSTGSGTAIFSGLRIDSAGTNKQLTASASGLTPSISNPFTVTSATLNNFAIGAISTTQQAGVPFTLTVTARDAFSNTVTSFGGTVALTTTAGIITPTTSVAFSSGVLTQPVAVTQVGTTKVITASSGAISVTSNSFAVIVGPFAKLQLLLPGEVAAPGTSVGKTGIPTVQTVGVPFSVMVNAVDEVWNPTAATRTVGVTSSDGAAILPANSSLVTGTTILTVSLQTQGTSTLTASAITDTAIVSNASPSVTVNRAFTITKTAQPSPVIAGQQITYTVTITRNSSSAASTVRLTDTLPVTVTGVTSTTSGGLVCAGTATVTCSLTSLAANASAVLTLTGTVSPNALNGEQLVNTGTVSADGMISAQSVQATTTVQRSVALTITKTATPNPVIAGNQITYTVRITNTGPSAASNLVVTDSLPLSVTSVTSSTTGGMTCSGSGNLTCNLASLGAGSSVTWTITGTVSASALHGVPITNTAGVTATEVSIAQTALVTTTVQRSVGLVITKTATPNPVIAGNQITYTVRITNTGPSAASNLVVTDSLPLSVTSVISSTTGGLACAGSTSITCTLASLSASSSVTLTITGTVSAGALHGTTITNTAGVTATEVSVAQTALLESSVTALADLSITKSEYYTGTVVGAIITYTLRITNTGPSHAQAVYITDTLPISVDFGSLIGMEPVNLFGAASNSGRTVTWMTDTLPVTSGGLITFTGTITGTGTLTNSVSITSTTSDNAPANNSFATGGFAVASAGIASMADLWLGVESAPSAIALGESNESILRAGNRGPLGVEGATVTVESVGALTVRLLTEPAALCPTSDGRIVCALPPLPVGGEIGIAVVLSAASPALVDSIWTIAAERFDPNPENNRLTQRWLIGGVEWRFFLPILQSNADVERNRAAEHEIYLPAVSNP